MREIIFGFLINMVACIVSLSKYYKVEADTLE